MLYVGWVGWMDGWIGSQTICTARAPLSGANKGFGDQHSQKALLISRGRKACGNFW